MSKLETPLRILGLRRGALLAVTAALAVFLLAIGSTPAIERVHFKNGHTIEALKVVEKDDMIFLHMADGSRIGFPKELVKERDKNAKAAKARAKPNRSGFGGRGPSMRQLHGYRNRLSKMNRNVRLAGSSARRPESHKGPSTYGFSYKGSGFNGGERIPSSSPNSINLLADPAPGASVFGPGKDMASELVNVNGRPVSVDDAVRAMPGNNPTPRRHMSRGLKPMPGVDMSNPLKGIDKSELMKKRQASGQGQGQGQGGASAPQPSAKQPEPTTPGKQEAQPQKKSD